jgi:hypothetical protein
MQTVEYLKIGIVVLEAPCSGLAMQMLYLDAPKAMIVYASVHEYAISHDLPRQISQADVTILLATLCLY